MWGSRTALQKWGKRGRNMNPFVFVFIITLADTPPSPPITATLQGILPTSNIADNMRLLFLRHTTTPESSACSSEMPAEVFVFILTRSMCIDHRQHVTSERTGLNFLSSRELLRVRETRLTYQNGRRVDQCRRIKISFSSAIFTLSGSSSPSVNK